MTNGRTFSRLMEEYGSLDKQAEEASTEEQQAGPKESDAVAPEATEKTAQALMQEEERETGAVSWSVYSKYFRFAGGIHVFPLILLWATLFQGAQGTPTDASSLSMTSLIVHVVANTLFLGFWTSSSIPGFSQADYMGTYAALGVANGIFAFVLSVTFW